MKQKNVEARLKIHLLQGKTITHNQALAKFGTNRLAEFIRRLRNKGMKIKMKLASYDGDVYGVYWLDIPEKQNKIKTLNYK